MSRELQDLSLKDSRRNRRHDLSKTERAINCVPDRTVNSIVRQAMTRSLVNNDTPVLDTARRISYGEMRVLRLELDVCYTHVKSVREK